MNAERLRDAGPEPICLRQHRHQERHRALRALSKIGERLEVVFRLISVVIIRILLCERAVGDLELVARFHDGLVQARARFDADDDQVQSIGQSVFNRFRVSTSLYEPARGLAASIRAWRRLLPPSNRQKIRA